MVKETTSLALTNDSGQISFTVATHEATLRQHVMKYDWIKKLEYTRLEVAQPIENQRNDKNRILHIIFQISYIYIYILKKVVPAFDTVHRILFIFCNKLFVLCLCLLRQALRMMLGLDLVSIRHRNLTLNGLPVTNGEPIFQNGKLFSSFPFTD